MPRNSSGTASRVTPPGPGGYVYGDIIDDTIVDSEINDIYKELSNSIDKGGRTTITANLPMSGYKHTGAGLATADTDYTTFIQTKQRSVTVSVRQAPFNAVGNGTTDDRAAIQAAIDYAETLSSNNSIPCGHVFVDLGGLTYGIGGPLLLNTNVQGIVIQNGGLTALSSATWTSSNAMIELSAGRWPHVRMLIMDAAKRANGILMEGGADCPAIESVKIYRYTNFGVKADGGFQLRMHRCHLSQFRVADTEYKVQASRTAYGFWNVQNGDMEIVDCIIECNLYNMYFQGGANFRIYGNHIFNGSGDNTIQHDNPVNIKIELGSSGSSHSFIIKGNYIDNGKIDTEVTNDCVITNNEFLNHNSKALLSEFIFLRPTEVNQEIRSIHINSNDYHNANATANPNIVTKGTGGGFNFTVNEEIQGAFEELDMFGQTGGRTVCNTQDAVDIVSDFVSSTTSEALVRFRSKTDASVITACGARGARFIIKTTNSERITVEEDGGVRIRNTYVEGKTTSNYTFDTTPGTGDGGATIHVSNSTTAVTYGLPNTALQGWWTAVLVKGSGTFTLTAASGATLRGVSAGSKTVPQYGVCKIICGRNIDGTSAEYYLQGEFA